MWLGLLKFLDAVALIKLVFEGTRDAVSSIISYMKKKKSERDQKKFDKAMTEMVAPKKENETVEQMIKRKKRAACEIEKMVNPSSVCDAGLDGASELPDERT